METMTILDFGFTTVLWLVGSGLFGAFTLEVVKYASNENGYDFSTRMGDVLLASCIAVAWAIYSPYLWGVLDGNTIMGIEITFGWYNGGTNYMAGLSSISLFKAWRGIEKKYIKKASE